MEENIQQPLTDRTADRDKEFEKEAFIENIAGAVEVVMEEKLPLMLNSYIQVGSAYYAKELQRFHQLQEEYLFIVKNDIKTIEDLLRYKVTKEMRQENIQARQQQLGDALGNISISKTEGMEAAITAFANSIFSMPTVQYESMGNALMEVAKIGNDIADSAKLLSDKLVKKASESAEKSAEKVSESAEKSTVKLSKRQKQILEYMKNEELYSTEEIANAIGLKGPRTRQLLNELVAMGIVECTAATKNRRYVKK